MFSVAKKNDNFNYEYETIQRKGLETIRSKEVYFVSVSPKLWIIFSEKYSNF